MTDDFENDLRRLLNEHVDARVGPRRSAPRFDPDRAAPVRPAGRVRTRWLPPLLAAACIAVLVGGGVATSQLLSADRNPAGPVTPAPGPTSATPSPTIASPAPTPVSSTPSHTAALPGDGSGSSPRTTSPPTHTITFAKGRISLPVGWVDRQAYDYERPINGSSFGAGRCLTPSSIPVSQAPRACPVFLFAPYPGIDLDVDVEFGYLADPHLCFGPSRIVSVQTGDRTFGGRAADWRRWQLRCDSGKDLYVEQYVVATNPAMILYTEAGSDDYHDVMTGIATRSSLPARTDPLRLYDTGYLRSIRRDGDTVRIELDRTVQEGDKVVDANPQTYPYTIRLALWRNRFPFGVKPGTGLTLRTDGREVDRLPS